ncbi:UdgX family uracil-DNA binding protein [Microbacterium sp. JZ37]|uniref:UdgX family uracil-DNA binding protein n=1 Tax=Microbacterium sp. JZ37 TaxID=2654193 RepID=UPI002B473502|nr:UdgX family uracil-DNA binding protein [Microbacterium sp. JZ37]WRH17915.1 UdgX family uracil-DNA binding protein [Microbacterium sp. JZ37]
MADIDRPGAGEWVPEGADLDGLRQAAETCRGCELWEDATQVVFSRGSAAARLMLVGEQPGDREDLEGEPFVGPAGRVLADALDAASVPDEDVYRTNAVKHFRFERRGKRRVHEKPAVGHLTACRPWLEAEIALVRPSAIVALGATAARSVLGAPVKIGEARGTVLESADASATPTIVTAHPSSLLRIREATDRQTAFDRLVDDLRTAARIAHG